jgi:hypothetical protein
MPTKVARDSEGKFYSKAICDSCQIVAVNGVACHEQGCTEAWKDELRECRWCDNTFKPLSQEQKCCDDSCHEAYYS